MIGWFGWLFWPYAYEDIFYYSFWPYGYDAFWPYAYDDVYGGIFGPYAYDFNDSYALSNDSSRNNNSSLNNDTSRAPERGPQVCSEDAVNLTNWPIERIARAVQPDAAQMAALEEFRRATSGAIEILKSECPTRLPSIPTERLTTLQVRLEVILRAIGTVSPALDVFYRLLNDDQRRRFDAESGQREASVTNQEQRDLINQACSSLRVGVGVPVDRIVQAIRLNESQRSALDNLTNATTRASEALKSSCPSENALTASARIDAMRQRLTAMLVAVQIVRPALESFYNSLDNDQKMRFNNINPQEG